MTDAEFLSNLADDIRHSHPIASARLFLIADAHQHMVEFCDEQVQLSIAKANNALDVIEGRKVR